MLLQICPRAVVNKPFRQIRDPWAALSQIAGVSGGRGGGGGRHARGGPVRQHEAPFSTPVLWGLPSPLKSLRGNSKQMMGSDMLLGKYMSSSRVVDWIQRVGCYLSYQSDSPRYPCFGFALHSRITRSFSCQHSNMSSDINRNLRQTE